MSRKNALLPTIGEIAGTGDGRDILQPWVEELRQHSDPRLRGVIDWGAYEKIRKDDQVKSCLEQRWRAVVSAEWDVLAGDGKDPRSVEAAARLKNELEGLGVDRFTKKMLGASFYGYSVAELRWQADASLWSWSKIHVRHARRFRYDRDGQLRLLTRASPLGEILPPRNFWVVTEGGMHDDEVYGEGLADWLYWPVLFKRNGLRFWNLFLDKFSTPTAKATYKRGTPQKDIDNIIDIMRSIARDTGFAVPEGLAVEFMEVARSGVADYASLCQYMDAAIAKIILSQTMTTDDGASLSQAKVHAGVALTVVKADADLVCEGFNLGPCRWWTDVNYGPEVAAPQLVRLVDEEEDLGAMAETDGKLAQVGWHRTAESFADTYGAGYEYRAPTGPKDERAALSQDPEEPGPASFAANDRRSLYVSRKLLNAHDLIDWARAQGFGQTIAPDDLHVTITYSRVPVDWMKMGGTWGWIGDNAEHVVAPGGPRMVERFGDAIVLVFFSGHLEMRHREMREAGASWDHPGYYPHVTITYDGAGVDLATVEPYRGLLRFGPEIFEPIVDAWKAKVQEANFAAPVGPAGIDHPTAEGGAFDEVDRIVATMLRDQAYRPLDPAQQSLVDALTAAQSPEDVRAALLQADTSALTARMIEQMARAGFAARLDAEGGGDG